MAELKIEKKLRQRYFKLVTREKHWKYRIFHKLKTTKTVLKASKRRQNCYKSVS